MKKRQTKWNVWVIKDKQDGFQNSPASQKEAHQRQSAPRLVSESFYQFYQFRLQVFCWAMSSTVLENLSQRGARVKWLQLRGGGEIKPLSLFCPFLVVFSSAGPAFTFSEFLPRQACSSHLQIVIWIWFWITICQTQPKYLHICYLFSFFQGHGTSNSRLSDMTRGSVETWVKMKYMSHATCHTCHMSHMSHCHTCHTCHTCHIVTHVTLSHVTCQTYLGSSTVISIVPFFPEIKTNCWIFQEEDFFLSDLYLRSASPLLLWTSIINLAHKYQIHKFPNEIEKVHQGRGLAPPAKCVFSE